MLEKWTSSQNKAWKVEQTKRKLSKFSNRPSRTHPKFFCSTRNWIWFENKIFIILQCSKHSHGILLFSLGKASSCFSFFKLINKMVKLDRASSSSSWPEIVPVTCPPIQSRKINLSRTLRTALLDKSTRILQRWVWLNLIKLSALDWLTREDSSDKGRETLEYEWQNCPYNYTLPDWPTHAGPNGWCQISANMSPVKNDIN